MKYLYGDATESPIRHNYIELLRDVLDFSVAMLLSDDMVQKYAKRAAGEEKAAVAELRQLQQVAQRVGKTLDAIVRKEPLPRTLKCLDGIRGAALAEIKRSESTIRQELQAQQNKIKAAMTKERSDNVGRLEKLLAAHDLPDSDSWVDVTLKGDGYQAEMIGRAPCQVDWKMRLDVPDGHLLAELLRLDRIAPNIALNVPEEAGWVRKSIKLRQHKLGKEYLFAIGHRAGTMTMALRSAPQGSDSGYDILYDRGGAPRSIRRYSKGVAMQPFEPDADDAASLRELGKQIRAAVDQLRGHRRDLLDAQLDGKPIAEHTDPRVLVERLIAQIAPVIQEISERSSSPTELVLKRVLADDRREELFASKKDLRDKLAPLPARLLTLFAPLALGEITGAMDDNPSDVSSNPSGPDLLGSSSPDRISGPLGHVAEPAVAVSPSGPPRSAPSGQPPVGSAPSAPRMFPPPPPSSAPSAPPPRSAPPPVLGPPPTARSASTAPSAPSRDPEAVPGSIPAPSAPPPARQPRGRRPPPPAHPPSAPSSSAPPPVRAAAEEPSAVTRLVSRDGLGKPSGEEAIAAPSFAAPSSAPMFPPPLEAPVAGAETTDLRRTLPGVQPLSEGPFAPAPSLRPLPKPSNPPPLRKRGVPIRKSNQPPAPVNEDSVDVGIDDVE